MANQPRNNDYASMLRHSVPIVEYGSNMRMSSDVLEGVANVELESYVDEARRSLELRMRARVLEDGQDDKVISVTGETVEGVWAAVCVYWLLPVFMYVAEARNWRWAWAGAAWAGDHATTIRSEQRYSSERRICPHIAVPDTSRHLEFVSFSDQPDTSTFGDPPPYRGGPVTTDDGTELPYGF